ncbi:MAG: tryptophan-rich sensory protein [Chlamydiae bacterium]|nr:tryptophan-rich sensory protein [Chlamydiota bacterium]
MNSALAEGECMKKSQRSSLLLFIASVVPVILLGFIAGQFTKSSQHTWYPTLVTSSINPPDIVFPIVWSILYVMIGIALWRLLLKRKQNRLPQEVLWYFAAQLLFNFLWTPSFFALRSPIIALVDILLLWYCLGMVLLKSYRISKLATALLIPYFLWVTFAIYLNAFIVFHN